MKFKTLLIFVLPDLSTTNNQVPVKKVPIALKKFWKSLALIMNVEGDSCEQKIFILCKLMKIENHNDLNYKGGE